MPTKDSGKPTSRKRASGAGKGADSTGQSRGTRKRAGGREQPTPTPTPTPTPAAAPTASTAPAASESAAPRSRAPRRRGSRSAEAPSSTAAAPAVPLDSVAQALLAQQSQGGAEPGATPAVAEPLAEPLAEEPIVAAEQAAMGAPAAALEEPPPAEEAEEETAIAGAGHEPDAEPGIPLAEELTDEDSPRRRDRRGAGTNALGVFIERQFANPTSPAHSYSDLERHSGISREALSRYVTARADRRRSPTIDTLVAIADALHVSLEAVARAAGASVRGIIPPPEDVQHAREETLGTLVAALSDEQFNAVVELLRQMRPPIG